MTAIADQPQPPPASRARKRPDRTRLVGRIVDDYPAGYLARLARPLARGRSGGRPSDARPQRTPGLPAASPSSRA